MRIYSTETGDSNWAPVAGILAVLVVVLIMGYVFWYGPSQQSVAAGPTHNVTINNPSPGAAASTTPTTIIMPSSQGATGATGSAGPSGPAGASGAAGSPGPAGAQGQPGSTTDSGSTGGSQ